MQRVSKRKRPNHHYHHKVGKSRKFLCNQLGENAVHKVKAPEYMSPLIFFRSTYPRSSFLGHRLSSRGSQIIIYRTKPLLFRPSKMLLQQLFQDGFHPYRQPSFDGSCGTSLQSGYDDTLTNFIIQLSIGWELWSEIIKLISSERSLW